MDTLFALAFLRNPMDIFMLGKKHNNSIICVWKKVFILTHSSLFRHAKSMNMNFSLAFEKLGVPMEHRRTSKYVRKETNIFYSCETLY
jgi:hypothetical protein